ncbi:MAG TPA: putative toxin-antitoxin system toxin component, PIN family [Thermoanaerobaculia bacterium]
MRVVLDTNVLVSGLISPSGPPGEILRLLETAPIIPCFSDSILGEYHEVLGRPKFEFPASTVASLLRRFSAVGERIAAEPFSLGLPDPKDEAFLAVALAAHADVLVTGNLRHFPARLRHGVAVVSPRDFLEALRGR